MMIICENFSKCTNLKLKKPGYFLIIKEIEFIVKTILFQKEYLKVPRLGDFMRELYEILNN